MNGSVDTEKMPSSSRMQCWICGVGWTGKKKKKKKKHCKTEDGSWSGHTRQVCHTLAVSWPQQAGMHTYVQDTARVWHTYLVWSDQDYVFGFAVKMPTARMLHDHTRGHVTTCHNRHLLTSLLLVCFDPCPFSFLRSFSKPRSLTNFSPKFSKDFQRSNVFA